MGETTRIENSVRQARRVEPGASRQSQTDDPRRQDNRPQAAMQRRLQGMADNSPQTRRLVTLQNSVSAAAAPMQCAYASRNYYLNNTARALHIDNHNIAWGATDPAAWPDRAGQRAILYETIATGMGSLARFAAVGGNPADVGLTLTLNAPYVNDRDNQLRQPADPPVHRPVPADKRLAAVKTTLDDARAAALGGWAGPPVTIATMAWEQKFRPGGEGLENTRSAVPFATLRKEAADNANARTLEAQLKTNRGDGQVWHKIGDDDMTFVNPNSGGGQMAKLAEVEAAGYAGANVVTFGYNLTTPGAAPQIAPLLEILYRREMELRDQISSRATTYPIEPNTYYKFDIEEQQQTTWGAMEAQNVGGGGGQIKEGLKFMKAARATVGADLLQRDVFHSVKEDTSAGGRNRALVDVITPLIDAANDGTTPDDGAKAAIRAAIVALDQNYFDATVWEANARQVMSAETVAAVKDEVNAMVEDALTAVVNEIFSQVSLIAVIVVNRRAAEARERHRAARGQ